MYLQRALGHFFSPAVKEFGKELQRYGTVEIATGGLKEVRGRVGDTTGKYQVSLLRDGDTIHPECSCAHFRSAPCTHLWAAIVEADRNSYLLGGFAAGVPKLKYVRGLAQPVPVPASAPAVKPPSFMERAARRHQRSAVPASPPKRPAWEIALIELGQAVRANAVGMPPAGAAVDRRREYYFVLDPSECAIQFGVEVACRDRKQDGTWGKLKSATLMWDQVRQADGAVGAALRLLAGAPPIDCEMDPVPTEFALDDERACEVLAVLAATGRLVFRPNGSDDLPKCTVLKWDPRPARFRIKMHREEGEWVLHDDFEIPGLEPRVIEMMSKHGVMVVGDRICPLDFGDSFEWVTLIRRHQPMRVPVSHERAFAAEVMKVRPTTTLELPEHLRYREERPEPTAVLRLQALDRVDAVKTLAYIDYCYGEITVGPATPAVITDAANRRLIRRNLEQEQARCAQVAEAGFLLRLAGRGELRDTWEIKTQRLPAALSQLAKQNWRLESEGRPLRSAGGLQARLTTGIDWFELEGEVSFDEHKIRMPELLKALQKGETMVALGDGSIGLLPDELLSKYGGLLRMGRIDGGEVRFARSQAGVLDVLLSGLPEVRPDERLTKLRASLREFEGLRPAPQPAGFVGQLRGYQQAGLAWLEFLEGIELGGCLADDMGVGKTPQVLALLERRRAVGKGPSLVVVPRSLIFNWKEEAARFTPELKILDYSTADRDRSQALFGDHNVVLTTYGTMLRDAASLKDFRFDYAILDEAQAIKNAGSDTAKAARLLQAAHRLVMTGTPVENHLGELWSLFEFLNPGMLGAVTVFQNIAKSSTAIDEATRAVLARALRPFILRRTKGQVAKELPERIEQTIHCELEGEQKKLYEELRDFYRAKLLGKAEKDFKKDKIQVLEALLRLRQAACHPGLIDKKRSGAASAKLDTLLARLNEVREEGHKTLVFSQFTSLLAIVRQRLDEAGVVYEYLDGSTRDRESHVRRFQTDSNCQVFLISLKAGGTGLNLTAAEYVFLLDPWWNPAVEAQAIDRAHRIGQARTVVACRLIAQGTVEERVLELQRSKRELAEAIIGEDNRLIGNLQREDLELLLS